MFGTNRDLQYYWNAPQKNKKKILATFQSITVFRS